MVRLLGDLADRRDAPALAGLVGGGSDPVSLAALDALAAMEWDETPRRLLDKYGSLASPVRSRVRELLLSRKIWAGALLAEVEAGRMAATEIPVDQLRVVALHESPVLDAAVKRHWGNIRRGTPEEQLAEMRRLNNDLNASRGDAGRGREVFRKLCAPCHQLHGEGGRVGPDLTHANRADREFLLASIVDPSAVIRKENVAYEVETNDVIQEQRDGRISLGVTTGETVVLPQSAVVSLRESAQSLMPENLLKGLKPQEVRDLFSHLQSTPPGTSPP
jgi:putative heme-binding domain-containing protein